MNRKIFLERTTKILVVGFVMFIQTLFAQDAKHPLFCHVIDDENAAKNFITDGRDLQRGSCTAYYINVFFHFIRDNSGSTGQPVSNVSQYMTILNNAYSGHNIHFISIGYDEIKNSTLAATNYDHMNNFGSITMNHQSNAINIYIFRADKTISGGVATRPGTRIAIGGGDTWASNYALSNVLSHEVGHALNLLHTFNGTAPGSSSGCAENPNGSNGTTCGDEVADTPADPNISFLNAGNCTNPFTMVVGGTTYNPNPTNIMSYATPNCLNHFTGGQATRMNNALASLAIYSPVRATITGAATICTNTTYSILGGVPSGTTVSWSSSNASAVTINSSGVASRVGSYSGNVTINAVLTNSSGCSMSISKTVWVGSPQYVMSIDGINTNVAYVYPGGNHSLNANPGSVDLPNFSGVSVKLFC